MGCSASKDVLVTVVQSTTGTCSNTDNVIAPRPRSSITARDSSKSSASSSSSTKSTTKVASVPDNSYITAAILSTRFNSSKPASTSRTLNSAGKDKLMFSVRHENQQYQIKVKHKKSRVKHHEGSLPDPATSRSSGKKLRSDIRRSKCSPLDVSAAEEADLAMDLCRTNPSAVEVINTWELMEGLEDEVEVENPSVSKLTEDIVKHHDGVSVLELQIPSSSIIQDSKKHDGPAVLSVMIPVKSAIKMQSGANVSLTTSEMDSGKLENVSRKTMTKYFASIAVDNEDDDKDVNCQNQINGTSSQVDPTFAQPDVGVMQTCKEKMHRLKPNTDDLLSGSSTACEDSHSKLDIDISNNEAAATPSVKSSPHASNLNRTLSFNYFLSDTSFKNSRTSSDSSSHFTAVEDMSSSDCTSEDSLVFITARVVDEEEEEEEENCPSSPEFSTAASLKDWLPWDAKHGSKITENIIDQHPALNVQVNHQQTDSVTSMSNIEALVFDPDLVDSFEKAMEQLSKEEWDAVRNMEESPRKFVEVVKSLKRTSSNYLHQRKMSYEDIRTSPFPSSNDGDDDDCNPVASTSTIIIGDCSRKQYRSSEAVDRHRPMIIRRQQSLEPRKQIKVIAGEDCAPESVDVIFYSTTSQSNPKDYEQCNQMRDILWSLSVISFEERSISEKPEYLQMLKNALGVSNALVPTVYVKGKYIVGLDSILQLYRKGIFISLLKESELNDVSDKNLVDC